MMREAVWVGASAFDVGQSLLVVWMSVITSRWRYWPKQTRQNLMVCCCLDQHLNSMNDVTLFYIRSTLLSAARVCDLSVYS